MTYQEYLELKAKRAGKLKEGEALLAKKDFDGHKALMGEVSKMNQELDAAEAQLAEEGRFAEDDEGMKLRSKAFQAKNEERPRARPSTRSAGATSMPLLSPRPCAMG